MNRLMFLLRLLTLPVSNIYRKIFMLRWMHYHKDPEVSDWTSPVYLLYHTVEKYNLVDKLSEILKSCGKINNNMKIKFQTEYVMCSVDDGKYFYSPTLN